MGDLFERGAAFLDGQRHLHMSRPVVYRRGAEQIALQASVGKTEFEQVDDVGGAGLIHRVESRDYLIRASDLVLGAVNALPRAGDQVREAAGVGGESVLVFEVIAPGGQPPWRYSDPYRRVLRIHTKYVGTES